MFKKLLCILSITALILGNPILINADEFEDAPVAPTPPVTEGLSADEANKLIDEYNEQVEVYNTQLEENYTNECEEVNQHNAAEDEKVTKSQEELAALEEKVEADQPGSTIENFTTDPEELPSDWSDTSEELHTIKIEEAEEKSGEQVSIINLHLYLDADQAPNEIFIGGSQLTNDQFLLTDEVKNSLLFAEWKIATFDLNDKVTVSSEGEIYKDDRILHEGKNYKVQDYNANFIRNVEDYTQGTWLASSEVASNSNTLEYGWGYDFETQTGKGGETYTFEFTPEERTQYYLDNGELKSEVVESRTIDGTEPKNIFSVFVYLFQRIWGEPEEYEPEYQKAPVEPEYLEKLDRIEKDEPTPTVDPEPDPEPVVRRDPTPEPDPIPEPTPEPEPVPTPTPEPPIDIIDPPTPQVDPQEIGSWALVNLISVILGALVVLGMIVTFFKKEKHYDENGEVEDKRLYSKLSGILPEVLGIILFIMTENIKLPMVLFDKWTIIMLLILLIIIVQAYITRRKDEDKEEE